MSNNKIGVISGVGPLAGSDVLAKIFKNAALHYGAIEDIEYPSLLLLNRGIEGIGNAAPLSDIFEKEIVNMVHELEQQGANIIGIACNTAHIYLDKITLRPQTKLVNLIDVVAQKAWGTRSNYLLLTSSASREQQLYHPYLKKYDVSFSETTLHQQEILDQAIHLVMARKLDEAGALLDDVLIEAKQNGFDAVIAGCTELPIALAHSAKAGNIHIIDSNDELAKALLRAYYA